MEPIAFVAASAEEAVAQIRARLGPEAVVLNVRPLPAQGLARLWQKPGIEVLAYRPETAPAPSRSPFRGPGRIPAAPGPNRTTRQSARRENRGHPGRPAGIHRPRFRVGLRRLAHRRGAAKDRPVAAPRPARSGPGALAARRESARLARGGDRAGARLPGGGVAAVPALPRPFAACGDRAGGNGQNDLPLQMAHPGGLGGRAAGAGVAAGRSHRQHGGIPDRLLRNSASAQRTRLGNRRPANCRGHWFY